MTNHTENFMNRVTQVLSRPIQTRCAELTVLFDKGSIKDCHDIFPMVIENIFGPQNSFSWELRTVTEAQNLQDFRALQHFLSPQGPMFRLIYTLLKDQQTKYGFSLNYLPSKVRQSLDPAVSHPFYAENLSIHPHTKQITSLILNPFDYYFFHFAYYLINPWHQRLIGSTNSTLNSGSVYFTLCCDYIMHFLPTEPGCTVLPSINYYVGKNPIQTLPTFVRPIRISKLFKPNVLADAVNEINALTQPVEQHPRSHIWRSETVLIVFVDMWLNNDQVVQYEQTFSPNKQQFHFHDLPTAEYIKIVRVLVKKLHSFSSSAKIDDTYMNELKKIAVPYMQGKMYIFLRNLIYRWPLDGSFRLVLELWLSFIQPWRYPGNEHLELTGLREQNDAEGLLRPSKLVDREYLPFIVDNLLAYVVIFQQLLPRFTKVDLSSPKIALMLYRMLKVMGQPMLANILREVESALENINNSPTHVRWPSRVPPLSPTSSWCSTNPSPNASFNKDHSQNYSYMGGPSLSGSFIDSSITYRGTGGKWSNIVKQKIVELENPNFCYKPLFATEPAQEVFDLIWHIQKAQHIANVIVRLRKEEESKSCRGIFGFFRMIFTQPDFNNDEFTLEERTKVPIILEYSLEFLVEIFQIRNLNVSGISKDGSADLSGLSSQMHKDDFPYILTPEKVRERVKNLRFEGDPDVQPIKSNENTFLVRILYQLSKKINEEFRHHINRLYYEQGFVGKICREVVSPPITVYKYEKSIDGQSPRIQESLPPRITLRPLASHKFLTYLALGYMVFHFCGCGIVSYLFFVFSLWSMSILLRVIVPKRRQSDSPGGPISLNLNDSFS